MWRSYKAETPDLSDETQEVDLNVSEDSDSDRDGKCSRSLSPCILINSIISDINIRRSTSKTDISVQRDEFYDLSKEDSNELHVPGAGRKSRSASITSSTSAPAADNLTLNVPAIKSSAVSPTPSSGSMFFVSFSFNTDDNPLNRVLVLIPSFSAPIQFLFQFLTRPRARLVHIPS
uniref:DUF3403 domain-containing protein n=1 Tax=Caenorhabditis tropicalis TaxID=1561998 RepID=A0A1I7UA83_9PELO